MAENPPLVVEKTRVVCRGFDVFVVRDDLLPGGTKQRALLAVLKDSPADEFVYAGPPQGSAQVALAHVAKALGKRATIFVSGKNHAPLSRLSRLARDAGADVVRVLPPNSLRDVQAEAVAYATGAGARQLIPFGFDTPEFRAVLSNAIRAALPPGLEEGPRRLWLVAGSGTILAALAAVWPKTHFLVVQVGKTVWPDQLGVRPDGTKAFEATKFVAPEKFREPARRRPPYPSVSTYDAKLWQFVETRGEDGDYVWNVGAEPLDGGRRPSATAAGPAGRPSPGEAARPTPGPDDFPYRKLFLPPPAEMFAALRAIARDGLPARSLRPGGAVGARAQTGRGSEAARLAVVVRTYPDDFDASDSLADHFCERARVACRERGEVSPAAAWAALRKGKDGDSDPRTLRELVYRRARGCNLFNEALAVHLIRTYAPNSGEAEIGNARVLDVSAGWGDRLIAAIAADVDYLGWDPNPDLQPAYAEAIATLGPLVADGDGDADDDGDADRRRARWKVIPEPFEDSAGRFDPGGDLTGGFDLALFCPPFFDKELYRGAETSTTRYPTIGEWYAKFYRPAVAAAAAGVRAGGHFVAAVTPGRMFSEAADELRGFELLGSVGFFQDAGNGGAHGGTRAAFIRDNFVWRRR